MAEGPPVASEIPPASVAATAQSQAVTSISYDLINSAQSLMGTVVIAIFVITFIVQAFQIPSESMENTLLVGDYLLVNKLCYGGRGLATIFCRTRRSHPATSSCSIIRSTRHSTS